jgi:hypothetical protein
VRPVLTTGKSQSAEDTLRNITAIHVSGPAFSARFLQLVASQRREDVYTIDYFQADVIEKILLLFRKEVSVKHVTQRHACSLEQPLLCVHGFTHACTYIYDVKMYHNCYNICIAIIF